MTFRRRCSGSATWILGLPQLGTAALFATTMLFGTTMECRTADAQQNPFATPPAAAPTATAPAAPGAAPAAPAGNPFGQAAPPPATPAASATPAPAAGANPFAPATPAAMPAATTPAAPAAPGANPFAPTAPATTAPTSNVATPSLSTGPVLTGLPSVAPPGPPPSGGFRVLAPGVMTTIGSPVKPEDRVSYHDIVEVLAEDPKFGERKENAGRGPMKNAYFTHDVWGLTFSFKPVRFLRIPGRDGKERIIWYMVYKVTNGPVKRYEDDETDPDPTKLKAVPVDKPFLFIPRFELESKDVGVTYKEAIIPEAVAAIQQREDKNRKLLNTGEITGELPITTAEADRSIWGVATWEGVDPRTDRFSIYIHGLTNVYKWQDAPGAYQKGSAYGTGRTFQSQVLKLNFWRPSDPYYQHEDEIRFGIPGEKDYEWFYK
jgi:hypothetical protein